MNKYCLSLKNELSSSNFSVIPVKQSPAPPWTDCKAILARAGAGATGTVTALPSGCSSGIGNMGSQNSDGNGSSSSGDLSTGAKTRITSATVFLTIIFAVVLFLLWRRKWNPKDQDWLLSGKDGPEFGNVPSQFTISGTGEMEAKEVSHYHVVN
jgi:preprotein translocase subunit SecG